MATTKCRFGPYCRKRHLDAFCRDAGTSFCTIRRKRQKTGREILEEIRRKQR